MALTELSAIIEHALKALECQHELVILKPGEKVPLFPRWPEKTPDVDEISYWLTRGMNYGVKAKDMVILDKDAADRRAYDWLRHRGLYFGSPWKTETRKGLHIFHRLAEGIEEARSKIHHLGLPVDIITGRNRFVVGPGSKVAGHEYALHGQIVPVNELPDVPRDLFEKREEVRASIQTVCNVPDERARRYVEKIATSEQTKGGSRAVFVACLKILSLTSGDLARAWDLLVYFNRTRCLPPWDEEAEDGADSLRRKLREARKVWNPQP